jgi:hypothetical protein
MINKEKFYETVKHEAELNVNYPYFDEEVWKPRLEALGEDEDEIINFIDNADKETMSDLFSIYDEIINKFPSEKMYKAIDSLIKNYQKAYN